MLEFAQSPGMATGLVTTTRITHATPAAFVTHVASRTLEDEIAIRLVQSGMNLMLGGGRGYLLSGDQPESQRGDMRDLLSEARALGYAYLETREELSSTDAERLLGLFSLDHMSYARLRNRTSEPSLAEMTSVAVQLLSRNSKGFFLMVEGGRIDHASHANDLDDAIGDMIAFDSAIGFAMNFTHESSGGLLVVTANHETGGLSIVPTPTGSNVNVSWTTMGHTGNAVPVYSEGDSASCFSGAIDNTDVGRCLFDAVRRAAQLGMWAFDRWDSSKLFPHASPVITAWSADPELADTLNISPLPRCPLMGEHSASVLGVSDVRVPMRTDLTECNMS